MMCVEERTIEENYVSYDSIDSLRVENCCIILSSTVTNLNVDILRCHEVC